MMLVALLVDIGLLSCSSALTVTIKKELPLSKLQLEELKKVPARSLEMVLNRKLAIDEKSRTLLMNVYEKADGTGYPVGVNEAKLTIESELIRLAKDFDNRTLLKMGRAAANHAEILNDIASNPKTGPGYSQNCRNIIINQILKSGLF